MLKVKIAFLAAFVLQLGFAQAQPLFKIVRDDKVGYINANGKVIIEPAFLNGNEFSEGLAAVRKDGLYGFIDETGAFVINPAFDFAANFIHGLALVHKNGQPYIIGKTGKTVLPGVYKSLFFLTPKKAIVTTLSDRQGVLDIATQKLLIDTLFSSISDFTYGVAVVEEFIPPGKNSRQQRVGAIDSTGKWIAPFGKYETIKPFSEGVAVVEIADPENKDGSADGAIDTKGNLLFKKPYKGSYIDGDFHDGYAIISLSRQENEGNYGGFINVKGIVVLDNSRYKYVYDFSNERAFVQPGHGGYLLIDKNFKQLTGQKFTNVLDEKFNNNYAIVETDEGWGIIDTSGNFVVKPQYDEIDQAGIMNNYFFFAVDSTGNRKFYGIADLNGRTILKPVMQEFDRNGFVNGLIKAIIDGKLAYINRQGHIVWQQQEDRSSALKTLNIDFMNRGYCYAYSTPKNTEAGFSGGWATSGNRPQKITGDADFAPGELSIQIDTNLVDTFASRFYGCRLFISNRTADTVQFNAQDSRLYIKMQAQDEEGEWKDIEYLPSSWCGNSYHQVELEPGAFWAFTIPKYTGQFQTRLRAELRYIDGKDPKKEKLIYSNAINASINPAQFWNKRVYYPNGIMDPYND